MQWRSKDARSAAVNVLPAILSKARIDGDRLVFQFDGMHLAQTGLSVLATSLRSKADLPAGVVDGFVNKAIRSLLAKTDQQDADAFLDAARTAERQYLTRPKQRFCLLSRLSLSGPEGRLREVRWRDTRLRFTKRPPRGFNRPAKADDLESDLALPECQYRWVRWESEGRDPYAAGEAGLEAIDEWRGVLNYTLTYGRARLSNSLGHPHPVNQVVSGPVHTVHDESGAPASQRFWWEPSHLASIPVRDLSHEELARIQRLTLKYRRQMERCGVREAVSALFVRYVRALDERDMQAAFLKLWGVLEVATETTRRNYDVTVKRAAAVWKDQASARAVLTHLRHRRNDLIHQGQDVSRPEQVVYSLKPYVDELLGRLVGNGQRFSSMTEFGEYLDLLRRRTTLDRQLHLVNLAMKAK